MKDFIKYGEIIIRVILWGFILLITLGFCSCDRAKQLAKIQRKAPYLFNRELDTILINDTVPYFIPGIQFSQIIPRKEIPDTFTWYNKEHDITGRMYEDGNDNYILDLYKPADTVYKIRLLRVPYIKYIPAVPPEPPKEKKRTTLESFKNILLISFFIFLAYNIFSIVRNMKKPKPP